jgi:hypothetical protein
MESTIKKSQGLFLAVSKIFSKLFSESNDKFLDLIPSLLHLSKSWYSVSSQEI